MKKPRKKQAFTSPPAFGKGKKKTAGHDIGGTFGFSPKKPEADQPPRTRTTDRVARMKRLQNKFI